jgi:hypothetical protein
MRAHKKNLAFTILFFLFFSCNENVKKSYVNVSSEFENIVVDTNMTFLKLSTIATSIDYIPLQTSENFIIGKIDKIKLFNNKFYILDKKSAKSLFIFDRSGKFLFSKTARKDELISINNLTDFFIDEKSELIYLYARDAKTIFVFNCSNGYLVRKIKLNGFFQNIAVLNPNSIILMRDGKQYADSYGDYKMCLFDSIGNLQKKWFDQAINKSFNIGQFVFDPNLSNGQFVFARTFIDTIYFLSDTGMNARYFVNLGGTNDKEIFTSNNYKKVISLLEKSESSYMSNFIFNSDSTLTFFMKSGNSIGQYNYNKKTKTGKLLRYIKNDIDNNMLPLMDYRNEKVAVSVIPADIVQQFFNLNSTTPDFKIKYKKLIELNNLITQDSNPVIALMSFN